MLATDNAVVAATGQQQPASTQQSTEMTAREIRINGEPMLKLPDDLYIPPDALEVLLETFQGPLDLLLYLIRKQNFDILNIPVALITTQYMEYVELMRHFKLDLAAEYLVMAAMLAEIKSRMLLPRPALEKDGDVADPRATLIRRLQQYERFSRAAQDIEQRPRMQRDLFLATAEFEDTEPVKVLAKATLDDLRVAFRNVMQRIERNKHWAVDHQHLTVREKMTSILQRISVKKTTRFDELFEPEEGRLGLVVCFVAILEMCRDSMLVVVQKDAFSAIHLKPIEGE